jgi:hypothetical protein
MATINPITNYDRKKKEIFIIGKIKTNLKSI